MGDYKAQCNLPPVKRHLQVRMREKPLLRKYQAVDADIINYGYAPLDGCSFEVRGPLGGDKAGRKIVCLGSAATFGRYVAEPYPKLLAERMNANVINLGFGGARFETYLREPATIALCKSSDLVILELMSARSYACDLFQPKDHLTGKGVLGEKYVKVLEASRPNSPLLGNRVFVERIHVWASQNLGWDELSSIRKQLLNSYRQDALRLIREIQRPVIVLWFSQRTMDAISKPAAIDCVNAWDCGFPHFVDRETAEAIRDSAEALVEVVSKRGIPSQLRSKKTGELVPISGGAEPHLNHYYPSPEMHVDAASAIADVLAGYWHSDLSLCPSSLSQVD